MTYVAIPLITAACLFGAAFQAWPSVARGSMVTAGLLAVAWLLLLVRLLWEGNIESWALGIAVVTVLTAGLVVHWLSGIVAWPPALLQVLFVEVVMSGLAMWNMVVGRNRRAGETPVAA